MAPGNQAFNRAATDAGEAGSAALKRGGRYAAGALEEAAAAPHAPRLAPDNPGMLESFESSTANTVLWQLPMLAPVAGLFAGAGKKFGPYVGAPFRAVAKVLGVPHEFMEKHTLGDAASATFKVAGAGGKESDLRRTVEKGLDKAGAHMDRALETRPMAPVRWLRDKTAGYHQRAAQGKAVKAVAAHTAAHGHLDEAINALQAERYKGVRQELASARNEFRAGTLEQIEMAEAARVAGGVKASAGAQRTRGVVEVGLDILDGGGIQNHQRPLPEVLRNRAKSLEASQEAFEKSRKTMVEELEARHKAAREAVVKAGGGKGRISALEQVQKAEMKEMQGVLGRAKDSFGKFAKEMDASHGHLAAQAERLEKAAFRQNLAAGLKGIPERLSSMSGMEALNHGLYYTAQGATAVRTAKLFTSGVDVLKHMEASITGKDIKKISTYHVLFGDVPEAMKEARSQYAKSVLPQAAANLAGMVAFGKMMKPGAGGKAFILGMGTQMAASMAGGMIAEKNGLLGAYAAVTRAQQAGQDIPAGAYLGIMVHASKKVRAMSQEDPTLLVVAQQYAAEKATAGAVMKELSNGAFDKRFAEAGKAQAAAAQQTDGARALLNQSKAPKPVHGKHTLAENARRVGKVALDAGQVAAAVSTAL